MNLIEQQSAAKDLPLPYLQQAVNGQNPHLTPWIATAELQRRTTTNQHMQPQGPQGPQPTVKDQVEQKAGLMATQAAQQAQAAQAQQGAAPPGPIPGGIPQPQPQPQDPNQPVMAARGGLMNAPVNFQFAHGGILGFAEAGPVPDPNARKMFIDEQGVERYADTGQPVPKSQSNVRATAEKYATEPTQAASLPAAISEEETLAGKYGLDKPMGGEQRQAMGERRAAYDDYKSRAADRAFAALVEGARAGPGQSGTMYEQARGQEYKDAAEFQREQIKDLSALETAQRAAQEKRSGVAGASLGASKLASAAERSGKAGIAGQLANIDAQVGTAKMQDATTRYNNEARIKAEKEIAALSRAMQNSQFDRQAAREAANRLDDIYRNIIRDEQVAQKELQAAQARYAEEPELAPLKAALADIRLAKEPAMNALKKKAGLPEAAPAAAKTLSAPDQQALNWANSNPKDPRAAQIKQRLGM